MPAAVILAGGRGRRLGQEKATLEFSGSTMIERAVHLVREVVSEVVVVARDEVQAHHLMSLVPEVAVTRDRFKGAGPLAGMEAGLGEVTEEIAFVGACDHPFLNPRVVEELFRLVQDHDAAVPLAGVLAERLHAVYRVDVAARACRSALERGERRIIYPLRELRVNYIPVESLRRLDPGLWTFFNLNTYDDLVRAREMARFPGRGRPIVKGAESSKPGIRDRIQDQI